MRHLARAVDKNPIVRAHARVDHSDVGRYETILEEDLGSIKGVDDFFSVAKTMPFVAAWPNGKSTFRRCWLEIITFDS